MQRPFYTLEQKIKTCLVVQAYGGSIALACNLLDLKWSTVFKWWEKFEDYIDDNKTVDEICREVTLAGLAQGRTRKRRLKGHSLSDRLNVALHLNGREPKLSDLEGFDETQEQDSIPEPQSKPKTKKRGRPPKKKTKK